MSKLKERGVAVITGASSGIGAIYADRLARSCVDGYVGLKDRLALEKMREHRQRMRSSLQERAGGPFDLSQSIRLCDEDIEVVEAGLARL